MSVYTLTLVLLSSIGFVLSGYYSAYLLFVRKNKTQLHLLLGGLLLVLSLRIGKSVFYNFTDLPTVVKNIGLAANLAIGPFLFLFGKVLLQQYELQRQNLWHFLPTAIYLIGCAAIPNQAGAQIWYVSYSFVIIQQLYYIVRSVYLVKDWKASWKDLQQKGFVILWLAISLIWFIYLLIFVQILPTYIFAAVGYSILVLVVAFFVAKEKFGTAHREKYSQNRLTKVRAQKYLEVITEKIEREKSYLKTNLNIQDVALQIDLPTKVISQVINEQLGLNFSAFINGYRIEEAKKRLAAIDYQQYTIASIAYDCGFNSISSFNTLFKAITKQTPSQYRRAYQKTIR